MYFHKTKNAGKDMSIINVKNLIYDYKNHEGHSRQRAVNNVTLDVNEGDFVAVIGHNGSGKSTFARHLNAMFMPTAGTVYVDDIDTKNSETILTVRRTAGLVFQNPEDQIVSTVVEEDVAFGPENLAVPTDEIRKRVDDSLTLVEMRKFAKRSPLNLSGGQKQRVAIAGILAMQPKCLVLDEPTSMLDPVGREEVINTLKSLNKEGITIILITHNMEEIVDVDKVFVMNKGELEMQGTPREIFKEVDKLKSFGLEVPQVTELAYELRKNGVQISDSILTAKDLVSELETLKG
ncbi:MAG TPA: energy-coupling factor transporter ATPase [Eubacterium sp.]|nr:energy-coupling factor transporter ATPase [Eubacterium sp.]